MVKIELIPKESVIKDIIDNWVNTGRADNVGDGQFIFKDAEGCKVLDGRTLAIKYPDKVYYYNMVDFYRVKVIF